LGENENELMPPVFTVTATYLVDGVKVSESTPIDLRPLKSSAIPRDQATAELARIRDEIHKIADVIKDAVSGLNSRRA
jgi:hypothetical protein